MSSELFDDLRRSVVVLHEAAWENSVTAPKLKAWLNNFSTKREQLHAIYLLSQFMYFGVREVDELLKAIYRDLFRLPLIAKIRHANDDTRDRAFVEHLFSARLRRTRFICLGNVAESSAHLLYRFRQLNDLPVELFMSSADLEMNLGVTARRRRTGCRGAWHQILEASVEIGRGTRPPAALADIDTFVFIDDLCGSGTQANDYSESVIRRVRRVAPGTEFLYFAMVATSEGLAAVRATRFTRADAIFEVDATYRCFGAESRYFKDAHPEISAAFAEEFCTRYGRQLWPDFPLGYKNGQLLLGFRHNTPDNTLPIIWADDKFDPRIRWRAIFPRLPKVTLP